MDRNSQNYSAVKTPIPAGSKLPQIVVQMPVYKESLDEVRVYVSNSSVCVEQQCKMHGRVQLLCHN